MSPQLPKADWGLRQPYTSARAATLRQPQMWHRKTFLRPAIDDNVYEHFVVTVDWVKYTTGVIRDLFQADYSKDFGSDRFLGVFLSSRAVSSLAEAGIPTLPSWMISFAVNFFP